MGYYNLVMSRESAWECLNELGELNALHFIEMDPDASIISKISF
jgi:V-type H+-transporting ATPase subunit a